MSRSLRTALSAALIALCCLLVPFGALAAWVAYGLTDTRSYVTTMAPLASDPGVRDAVADTVSDEMAREAGMNPLFLRDAFRSFTATRAYRTAWDAGNEAAHTAVMRALQDDRAGRDGRPVTVDLATVTTPLKQRLTLDHVSFAARIPVEHTQVALLPSHDLAALRRGYHVLDIAGFWLPLAAVVFGVSGIAVASCRRRAVTATALGTALGGAFLGLAIALGRRLTLDDLPDEAHRPAAGAVYDALTATLRTASWLLLALGLTVAAATWLSRPESPLARLLRHRRHPVAPATTSAPAPPPEPTHVRV
ncbi:hypothetical protein PYK79_52680 [Streptomyces sp. ID05-04B]|uniref:hypothetical protein n=1 Tax=unclassified Streptomyces TaxID=2593676 RepID=UPI000D1B8E07|nr:MULTISPECIES: hypothetical protein [unclassified Streptomyces]AVV41749.1 hypothetical protein C6376_10130 [Streptomyces sp. P3]MDX5570230.1 hypothetical protein [Streptomyces sp. ID05-04B]